MTGADARPAYTFRDTPLAVQRLELVAQVFDAPSRAFLTEAVVRRPRVALDLGCGPGVTTRLVAETTGAGLTVGVDTSPAFLEVAARDVPAGVAFVRHDVTTLPLPCAPVDLLYARLLLAHLADVEGTVARWAGQLTRGGRLVVDEVEWIETAHPVLAAYESVVVGLVASRGGSMYAGPAVDRVRGVGWEPRSSRVRTIRVATADAARMFLMNLTTWRDDPHVRERHDPDAIERLGHDLSALAASPGTGEITWGLRQVAFERVAP
jgi:trans-aconitate 2-methyltransferase